MKDDQISHQRKFLRPLIVSRPPAASNRASPSVHFKRLTWEEMQHRRTQGLCFNCNEKFTASHKCTKAQLLLLESEELPDEAVNEKIMGEEITREPGESVNPRISLYALIGWATPQTMRVMARIRPYKIIVLIDNGSTHNFISTKLANMLQLPIKPMAAFTVRVANGENLIC